MTKQERLLLFCDVVFISSDPRGPVLLAGDQAPKKESDAGGADEETDEEKNRLWGTKKEHAKWIEYVTEVSSPCRVQVDHTGASLPALHIELQLFFMAFAAFAALAHVSFSLHRHEARCVCKTSDSVHSFQGWNIGCCCLGGMEATGSWRKTAQ